MIIISKKKKIGKKTCGNQKMEDIKKIFIFWLNQEKKKNFRCKLEKHAWVSKNECEFHNY